MFVGSYNKIRDLDIFAKRLGLFYNGGEKVGSSFGLILTLIYILASIFILIFYTISIVKKEDVQVNDSIEYSSNIPYINLNNSNLLYLAFGVEKVGSASRFIDETIYYPKAFYYYGEKSTSGGEFNTLEYRNLKIEKCQVEKFGKNYQHLFTKGEFDESYCLSELDFALTGGFIYDKFSCIQILIYPCYNNTENNNKCKPQEEIDKVLAGGYFSLLLKDIGLNPNNQSNPVLPTIQDFYTTISKDFFRDVIFNYEITDIISDEGIIFERKKKERYLKYDKIKESFYLRNDTEYYKGESIIKIDIRLSDNIHVQRRAYKKFANALATTGGYMQMIYTIFLLLSLIPNNFKLETIIVNGLFNLCENNKEENLNKKYYFNKDDRPSKVINIISSNGKNKYNNILQSLNLNLNSNKKENLEMENLSNSYKKSRAKSNNKILRINKTNKNNLSKDILSLNKESVKSKSGSLIDQSLINISKIEMNPKTTGFNIINPDNSNINKTNNKFLNYNNINRKNSFIKEIKFSIFEFYCFRKCYKKRKKIYIFNKCVSIYKEQMDIINIFKDFLKNRTNIVEKQTLNKEMKFFSE